MTVIGALASFRELGEMSPHKRASSDRSIDGLSEVISALGIDSGRITAYPEIIRGQKSASRKRTPSKVVCAFISSNPVSGQFPVLPTKRKLTVTRAFLRIDPPRAQTITDCAPTSVSQTLITLGVIAAMSDRAHIGVEGAKRLMRGEAK